MYFSLAGHTVRRRHLVAFAALVILVASGLLTGDVDDGQVAGWGAEVAEALGADPAVVEAVYYWSLDDAPPLRSHDGTAPVLAVTLEGDDDAIQLAATRLTERLEKEPIR